MWRLGILILLCGLGVSPAHAQDNHKIACYAYPKTTESYKKKLWDGYEISLGPARNAEEGDGNNCTAAIYNAAGKVVFRTTGFGVILDEEHTGMDFDGDGKRDVVFATDQAGGAHCCWVYNVVSLAPKPHKLFHAGDGASVDFVKESDGRIVIWERLGGPYEYTSQADRPYAERASRFQSGKLTDVTPEFCDKLFSGSEDYDIWTQTLTPENLKKLQSAQDIGVRSDVDIQEIASALLSRAFQRVLCHEFDEAAADLNRWPEDSRDEMKANFAESVKSYNPEFAARLSPEPAKK